MTILKLKHFLAASNLIISKNERYSSDVELIDYAYTKLDVNFCRFMLLYKNRYLWGFRHELRRRIYPNTQETEAG